MSLSTRTLLRISFENLIHYSPFVRTVDKHVTGRGSRYVGVRASYHMRLMWYDNCAESQLTRSEPMGSRGTNLATPQPTNGEEWSRRDARHVFSSSDNNSIDRRDCACWPTTYSIRRFESLSQPLYL